MEYEPTDYELPMLYALQGYGMSAKHARSAAATTYLDSLRPFTTVEDEASRCGPFLDASASKAAQFSGDLGDALFSRRFTVPFLKAHQSLDSKNLNDNYTVNHPAFVSGWFMRPAKEHSPTMASLRAVDKAGQTASDTFACTWVAEVFDRLAGGHDPECGLPRGRYRSIACFATQILGDSGLFEPGLGGSGFVDYEYLGCEGLEFDDVDVTLAADELAGEFVYAWLRRSDNGLYHVFVGRGSAFDASKIVLPIYAKVVDAPGGSYVSHLRLSVVRQTGDILVSWQRSTPEGTEVLGVVLGRLGGANQSPVMVLSQPLDPAVVLGHSHSPVAFLPGVEDLYGGSVTPPSPPPDGAHFRVLTGVLPHTVAVGENLKETSIVVESWLIGNGEQWWQSPATFQRCPVPFPFVGKAAEEAGVTFIPDTKWKSKRATSTSPRAISNMLGCLAGGGTVDSDGSSHYLTSLVAQWVSPNPDFDPAKCEGIARTGFPVLGLDASLDDETPWGESVTNAGNVLANAPAAQVGSNSFLRTGFGPLAQTGYAPLWACHRNEGSFSSLLAPTGNPFQDVLHHRAGRLIPFPPSKLPPVSVGGVYFGSMVPKAGTAKRLVDHVIVTPKVGGFNFDKLVASTLWEPCRFNGDLAANIAEAEAQWAQIDELPNHKQLPLDKPFCPWSYPAGSRRRATVALLGADVARGLAATSPGAGRRPPQGTNVSRGLIPVLLFVGRINGDGECHGQVGYPPLPFKSAGDIGTDGLAVIVVPMVRG